MEDDDISNGDEQRRPVGMTLLSGLYLFFFILTISSYGQPVPFLGGIYYGRTASILIFVDSLICLYLFLGLMKRQTVTWYLLLGYNAFELVNTLTNLFLISTTQLEKAVGEKVNQAGLVNSNMFVIAAILLLSWFIFRQRDSFNNPSKYLF